MNRSGDIPFIILKILFAVPSVREGYAFCSGRSSGLRIILITAPSHSDLSEKWHIAVFVPDHSGGPATDFHRLPFMSFRTTHECL